MHTATNWMMGVRVPVGAGNFSLHYRVQAGSNGYQGLFTWR